jgi:hypothetical protein
MADVWHHINSYENDASDGLTKIVSAVLNATDGVEIWIASGHLNQNILWRNAPGLCKIVTAAGRVQMKVCIIDVHNPLNLRRW